MGVLSGYRVLDLSDARGRMAGKLLADLGADISRVVSLPDDAPPNGEALYCGIGTRTVALDIAGEPEKFREFFKGADIIIESFRPGYLARLGLDHNSLSKANPGLVMCSITDYGRTGPQRERTVPETVLQAESGWLSVSGRPDEPLALPGNQACHTAALFAVNGILLALRQRRQTGRGQHIDISIQECAAAVLDHVLVRYAATGDTARRQGSLHWNNTFRAFPCKDGHILLSLHREWDTLVEWLASESVAEDLGNEQYRDEAYRNEHIGHIIEVLEKWTKSHAVDDLVETGRLMRYPWAKVASLDDVLHSPQLHERSFFRDLEHEGRTYRVPGPAVRLKGDTA